jgi:hypothetical protein
MWLIKLLTFLSLFFLTNSVDHVRVKCEMKLGKYADRDIFISKTNVCYVKNYDIYIDVDSFMNAAVRVNY